MTSSQLKLDDLDMLARVIDFHLIVFICVINENGNINGQGRGKGEQNRNDVCLRLTLQRAETRL